MEYETKSKLEKRVTDVSSDIDRLISDFRQLYDDVVVFAERIDQKLERQSKSNARLLAAVEKLSGGSDEWLRDVSILKEGDMVLVAWPWESSFHFKVVKIVEEDGKLVVDYDYDDLTSPVEEYFDDDEFFHVLNRNLEFKQVGDHWEAVG